MKPWDTEDPGRKTGVSGLWIALAAAAGAAIAYLGDPLPDKPGTVHR